MKLKSLLLTAVIALFLFVQCAQQEKGRDFAAEGFTSIFNGKDLTGWKIPPGDNGHWKVLNDVIDYDALSEAEKPQHLFTEADYKDFELHIEWRFKEAVLYPMPTILPNGDWATDSLGNVIHCMMPNADSGIILRGDQQLNIWCWNVGSGELWTTRMNKDLAPEERAKAVPKFHADNPVGEWNAFDITLKGDRVTAYLNDILVIEDGLMLDLPESGPIGLQHHGGIDEKTGKMGGASSQIQFRNIWIKEI